MYEPVWDAGLVRLNPPAYASTFAVHSPSESVPEIEPFPWCNVRLSECKLPRVTRASASPELLKRPLTAQVLPAEEIFPLKKPPLVTAALNAPALATLMPLVS